MFLSSHMQRHIRWPRTAVSCRGSMHRSRAQSGCLRSLTSVQGSGSPTLLSKIVCQVLLLELPVHLHADVFSVVKSLCAAHGMCPAQSNRWVLAS